MRDKLGKYKLELAVLKAALKGNKSAKIVTCTAVYFLLSGIYFNIAKLIQFIIYLINL